MSSTQKAILYAAIVGGACGIAGAAVYLAWRSHHRSAEDRVPAVVRQLEKLADRIQHALAPHLTDPMQHLLRSPVVDARGIALKTPDPEAPAQPLPLRG